MDLQFDLVAQDRPKLGLIVLQADESIENDMRRMIPTEVDLLVSRVPSGTAVSSESLAQMAKVLTDSAGMFPAGAQFASVGYGCTSGTAEIGADRIAALIRAGTQADAITEPVSALVAACRAANVSRIGLISPYVAQVSEKLIATLAAQGVQVTTFASFNEAEESKVVRIAPQSIANAARRMANAGTCEAVFLSCTNLRTLEIIDDVETTVGMPILSSNQVLAWDMLRQAGIAATAYKPGRIWTT